MRWLLLLSTEYLEEKCQPKPAIQPEATPPSCFQKRVLGGGARFGQLNALRVRVFDLRSPFVRVLGPTVCGE
jgi:hypothetical protein